MKLVMFLGTKGARLGGLDTENKVLDFEMASRIFAQARTPSDILEVIDQGPSGLVLLKEVFNAARSTPNDRELWLDLQNVKLMAPIPRPRKNVFCVGRNYRAHVVEMARARGAEPTFPARPEFFTKPPTTVIGPWDNVERHAQHTERLDYEVELAVVIGRRVRNLSESDALSAVFGYTIINDITARDAQRAHGQFFKGKSFDTFCPMGPCIVTADEFGDPSGHRIYLKVNGEKRQDSSTADLIFSVPQILASLSAALTLEPCDIVATGTPSGVAQGMVPQKWLQVGDLVEASVDGIGVLQNKIA